MKKIILLFILIPGISFGATMNMIGEKGEFLNVTNQIKSHRK